MMPALKRMTPWRALGASIGRSRAVLVVSAHWYIRATAVTAMASARIGRISTVRQSAMWKFSVPTPPAD
jgi:4,5-DOPA dioxygenase extradiol